MRKQMMLGVLMIGLATPVYATGGAEKGVVKKVAIHKRVGHALAKATFQTLAFSVGAGLRIVRGSKSDPSAIKMGASAAKHAGDYYDSSHNLK